MPPRKVLLMLVSLAFALGMLAPPSAVASGFTPTWSVTGWSFGQDMGNADGDPQHEILFSNNADGHLAIFDALTGLMQQEFSAYSADNTIFVPLDVDGDSRVELFFSRPAPPAATPLFTAYHWNGSGFVPFFSHTDPLDTWVFAHVRSAAPFDILEVGGNDVRVRDLTGSIIYRASTAIPGWSGQPVLWASPADVNHDGISEILINDHETTRLVTYSGSFAQSWLASGWYLAADAGNLDGDSQSEFAAAKVAGGRRAVLDGLTGTVEKEFPDFTIFNSGYQVADLDANGLGYIFFSIQPGLGDPLFTAFHWNGSSLAQLFSHADPLVTWNPAHFRNTAQFEILEEGLNDIRVRDLSGNVLFRASTDIPGWSGQNPLYSTNVDFNHDGIFELLINDHDTVRFIEGAVTFTQLWVANGWQIGEGIGNADGDPQDEILLSNVVDERYGLFDGLTGALEVNLPDFATGRSGYVAADVDGDDRVEIFMYHYLTFGQSPLFTAYTWNGSNYATMFSHTDSLQGADIRSLRSAGQFEVLEAGPSDVRLRDMSGAVIFRASTDLPGWAGLDPNSSNSINSLDFDLDGVQELVITDLARVRFINYRGTTAVAGPQTRTAFQVFQNSPNPFRTTTSFRISTPKEGNVGVRIFDAGGRLIRRLDQRLSAGMHEIRWDGKDAAGRVAPSGVLFYEVTVDGFRQTRKVVHAR